jgi:hypothetical protein
MQTVAEIDHAPTHHTNLSRNNPSAPGVLPLGREMLLLVLLLP